jgi:hypothetical protein
MPRGDGTGPGGKGPGTGRGVGGGQGRGQGDGRQGGNRPGRTVRLSELWRKSSASGRYSMFSGEMSKVRATDDKRIGL